MQTSGNKFCRQESSMDVEIREQIFGEKQDICIGSEYFLYMKLIHYKEKRVIL